MAYVNTRAFMRAGRAVRGYTAWRSPSSLGGGRLVQGRSGGKILGDRGFGIVSSSVGNGRGGFTQRTYLPGKASMARFDRLFNRASGGGGKATRNTAIGLRSAGGRQG